METVDTSTESAEESDDAIREGTPCPTVDENYQLRKLNASYLKQIQQLQAEIKRLTERGK